MLFAKGTLEIDAGVRDLTLGAVVRRKRLCRAAHGVHANILPRNELDALQYAVELQHFARQRAGLLRVQGELAIVEIVVHRRDLIGQRAKNVARRGDALDIVVDADAIESEADAAVFVELVADGWAAEVYALIADVELTFFCGGVASGEDFAFALEVAVLFAAEYADAAAERPRAL